MRIQILGGIAVLGNDGVQRPVGGPAQQRLLAALTLRSPEFATVDWLSGVLWPISTAMPTSPPDTVRTYVARLRRALGDETIRTGSNAYALLPEDSIDARVFEDMVIKARNEVDVAEQIEIYTRALDLWQDEPFGMFGSEESFLPESNRLIELQLTAQERLSEAELALGDGRAAIPRLQAMVAEQPLREMPRRLLMLALYNTGAQAEALRVFQEYRTVLIDELGLEVSPELAAIELGIATRDVALLRPADVVPNLRGFDLQEQTGETNLGPVYRAFQPSLGRPVTINMIRKELADRPDFIGRFEVKAQAIARLEHPNIVPLYQYWRDPTGAYLVSQLPAGGTLADRLSGAPQQPLDTVRQWVAQVGAAVDAAHRSGVVHQHLGADNIAFDLDGNAFVAGFGIAAFDRTTNATSVTSDGVAADVQGLARAVYRSLAGQDPSPQRASQVHKARPDVTAEAAAVLSRALWGHQDHQQTMIEFVSELLQSLGNTQDSALDIPTGRDDARAPNPFRGLHAFDEVDSELFFGRERLITSVLEHLADHRFVAVVGPSGSGKSSLVRAGVVPRLRSAGQSFVVTITPGVDPFVELESALLGIAAVPPDTIAPLLNETHDGIGQAARHCLPDRGAELIVVVDQLEELYTLTGSEDEATRFIDGLVACATNPMSQVRVIVTIRADFFDRPLRHQNFGSLVVEHQVTTLPLRPDELERAISGPAEAAGATVEAALVAAVAEDMAGARQALPMLQYTLTELFDRGSGKALTLSDYRKFGGLWGTIAARAEVLYEQLDAEPAATSERVFLELVTLGEGAEDTRRRVALSLVNTMPGATEILDGFGAARLLTFDHDPVSHDPTVEVAHEALIRQWPRYRRWIDASRDELRFDRQVIEAAERWANAGSEDDDLLRGGRLETAIARLEGGSLRLSEQASEYVQRSIEHHQQQLHQDLRVSRRLQFLVRAVACVAVVALIATAIAVVQQRRAADEAAAAQMARSAAETRRLSADAAQLVDSNRRLALLLAAEAFGRDQNTVTTGGLQSVLTSSEGFKTYLGGSNAYRAVAWLDRHRLVASTGSTVQTISLSTGEVLNEVDIKLADHLTYHQDTRVLAVPSLKTVTLLNPELVAVGEPLEYPANVESLALGQAGEIVAGLTDGSVVVHTPDRDGEDIWSQRNTFVAHPEQSLSELGAATELAGSPHQPETFLTGVHATAISSDGALLATGSLARVRIWDARTGEQRSEFNATFENRDGDRFASGVADLRFDEAGRLHVATAFNVATWSADGGLISEAVIPGRAEAVTTGADADATVRLIGSGAVVGRSGGTLDVLAIDGAVISDRLVLETHLAGRPAIGTSPDGRMIALGSTEGIAVLTTDQSTPISRSVQVGEQSDLGLTGHGEILTTSAPNRAEATLWDLRTDPIEQVTLESDRRPSYVYPTWAGVVANYVADRPALTFDEFRSYGLDLRERYEFVETESAQEVSDTPDGALLVDTSGQRVTIRDGTNGGLLKVLTDLEDVAGEDAFVRSVGFTPDGTAVAAATTDGAALVWDTETWEVRQLSSGGDAVVQVKFSHDGRWLATIDGNGVISLRDPQSLQPQRQLFGNTDAVSGYGHGPFFDLSGRFMITAADRLGRLWDLEAGVQVGRAIPSSPGVAPSASSDGRWLATLEDGMAKVWDMDVSRWFDVACTAAGRNMTVAEWEQFGPADAPYQATCDRWPSLDG